MSAIFAIVGWYAAGFLLADRMVLRGHSPVVWWTAAAVLGAAVTLPAILALAWRHAAPSAVEVIRTGVPLTGIHVAAVGRPDDLPTTIDHVPPAIAERIGRVSLIATIGHEGFNPVVDTGELASAERAIARVRPFASDDDLIVSNADADGAVAALRRVALPDLVVSRLDARSTSARRQVRNGIETSSRCAVPVLLLPAAGVAAAESRASAVAA